MYEIHITSRAKKYFRKIARESQTAISEDILSLEKGFIVDGDRVKKIKSVKGFLRLRSGSYRIIFYVRNKWLYIVNIVHRKDWEETLKNLL